MSNLLILVKHPTALQTLLHGDAGLLIAFFVTAPSLKVVCMAGLDVNPLQRKVTIGSEAPLLLSCSTQSGDQFRLWFPHGTSHFIGMNVHDVGSHDEKPAAAIEPAVKKYQGIGVRIEDDVVVTEAGFEMWSEKAPRSFAEIEALMRR